MKKQHIQLSKSDKATLESLLSKGSLRANQYKRITGLLALDAHQTFQSVSQQVGVSYPTVLSWAKKYKTDGLRFLEDQPRSGRPKDITALQRAKITSLACSDAPEGHSQWSLRLLADKAVELGFVENISHQKVQQILKKTT